MFCPLSADRGQNTGLGGWQPVVLEGGGSGQAILLPTKQLIDDMCIAVGAYAQIR